MHRIRKAVLSGVCALALVIFPGMAAHAEPLYFPGDEIAAKAVSLPSSFLIGDSEGIKVGVDGVYYIEALGVVPGDVFTKRLTIQNLDMSGSTPESSIPYTLAMRAEPLFNIGPVDLLDVINLELKLDGQIIYSGRVRGDAGVDMIQNALNLGTYQPGDQRALEIKLSVGTNWELSYEKSEAEFKWIFYAFRLTPLSTPKTGVTDYAAIGLIGGMVLLWLFLLLKKKKRNRNVAVEGH